MMNQAKDSALIAIQYLFATQSSFVLDAQSSATSVFDYNPETKTICTEPMTDEGACFGLNLEYFSIDVLHPDFGEMASYPLSNANHLEIINWIGREKYLLGIEANLNFKTANTELEKIFHDRYNHAKLTKDSIQALDAILTFLSNLSSTLGGVFDAISALKVDSSNFDFIFNCLIDQQTFELKFSIADNAILALMLSNSGSKNECKNYNISELESIKIEELIKSYVSEFLVVKG